MNIKESKETHMELPKESLGTIKNWKSDQRRDRYSPKHEKKQWKSPAFSEEEETWPRLIVALHSLPRWGIKGHRARGKADLQWRKIL